MMREQDRNPVTDISAAVKQALAAAGLVNGMYGTVPYTLHDDCVSPDGCDWLRIIASGRTLGYVKAWNTGKVDVCLDFAGWLNPDPGPIGVTGSVGTMFGVNMFVSENVPKGQAVMWDRKGVTGSVMIKGI